MKKLILAISLFTFSAAATQTFANSYISVDKDNEKKNKKKEENKEPSKDANASTETKDAKSCGPKDGSKPACCSKSAAKSCGDAEKMKPAQPEEKVN
jgi:hypothetical protein